MGPSRDDVPGQFWAAATGALFVPAAAGGVTQIGSSSSSRQQGKLVDQGPKVLRHQLLKSCCFAVGRLDRWTLLPAAPLQQEEAGCRDIATCSLSHKHNSCLLSAATHDLVCLHKQFGHKSGKNTQVAASSNTIPNSNQYFWNTATTTTAAGLRPPTYTLQIRRTHSSTNSTLHCKTCLLTASKDSCNQS